MNESLRAQVRARAGDRCEYCQLPQLATIVTHEADHIRSQKHNGPTTDDNLCWACGWCNAFKGSDVAGFDPQSDRLTPLFNPRAEVGGTFPLARPYSGRSHSRRPGDDRGVED